MKFGSVKKCYDVNIDLTEVIFTYNDVNIDLAEVIFTDDVFVDHFDEMSSPKQSSIQT